MQLQRRFQPQFKKAAKKRENMAALYIDRLYCPKEAILAEITQEA